MGIKINLVGKKFGRLSVISEAPPYKAPSGRMYIMWNCVCKCGNKRTLRTSALTSKSSRTKSCGCLSAELSSKRNTTHSMSKSRTYTSYAAMKKRCTNKNDPTYEKYGGRGITVCERWLHSFQNFYEDMGERPLNTSIDRIQNDKGYYKENCRWASKSIQQINRRKTGKTSKYRGVCYSKRYKCYVAQVYYKYKNKKIGNFKTEEEAAIAYNNYIIMNRLPHNLNKI